MRAWFLHKSDEYAAKGDAKGVDRMHMFSFLSYALVMAVVMAVCYSFGAPAVEGFLAVIPQFVKDGISVAAGILPALGFALLASMLLSKKVAPFFMLGFILSAYLGMPVLGIAMLGIIIVALMLTNDNAAQVQIAEGGEDDDF